MCIGGGGVSKAKKIQEIVNAQKAAEEERRKRRGQLKNPEDTQVDEQGAAEAPKKKGRKALRISLGTGSSAQGGGAGLNI